MDIGLILLYLEKQEMWDIKDFGRERRVIFFECIESQIPVEKVIEDDYSEMG